jgi:D-alanyl-D-alanine carboxypeptidase
LAFDAVATALQSSLAERVNVGAAEGCHTALRGVPQAKTGTMHGISSLSGYLSDGHGSPAIFSILVDSALATTPQLRAAVDGLVRILTSALTLTRTRVHRSVSAFSVQGQVGAS